MCMMFIRQFVVCIIVQSHAFLLVVFATLSRIYNEMQTLRFEKVDTIHMFLHRSRLRPL